MSFSSSVGTMWSGAGVDNGVARSGWLSGEGARIREGSGIGHNCWDFWETVGLYKGMYRSHSLAKSSLQWLKWIYILTTSLLRG